MTTHDISLPRKRSCEKNFETKIIIRQIKEWKEREKERREDTHSGQFIIPSQRSWWRHPRFIPGTGSVNFFFSLFALFAVCPKSHFVDIFARFQETFKDNLLAIEWLERTELLRGHLLKKVLWVFVPVVLKPMALSCLQTQQFRFLLEQLDLDE